jgi:hypothetical protein
MLPQLFLMLALAPLTEAQEDAAGRFYDDRLVEFQSYLDARGRMARSEAERRAIAAERAACKRRIEAARMGYTGLSPEEQSFWDSLRSELDAVLNLWQHSAEAEEGEKNAIRQAAGAALLAAQRAYEAQMRFGMAQLGMAGCLLDADTVNESASHFRAELQREYRQDFQAVIYAVPWGLEETPDEEEAKDMPTHESGEAEEGNVDLDAVAEDAALEAPSTPLMVQELAHEVAHTDAARAESAGRAAALWLGYLKLCAQQVELCFGSERGAALVAGVPLPGAVEMSYFQAVQERSKRLFLEAEQAWEAYVAAVEAAHDPGWQASEGAMAHTPVSAEARQMRFPLYATHEQYLAFVLSPHLQYAEPEPMPDTTMADE